MYSWWWRGRRGGSGGGGGEERRKEGRVNRRWERGTPIDTPAAEVAVAVQRTRCSSPLSLPPSHPLGGQAARPPPHPVKRGGGEDGEGSDPAAAAEEVGQVSQVVSWTGGLAANQCTRKFSGQERENVFFCYYLRLVALSGGADERRKNDVILSKTMPCSTFQALLFWKFPRVAHCRTGHFFLLHKIVTF